MRGMFVWGASYYADCLLGTYTDPAEYLDVCGYPDVPSKRASFFYMLRNPHDLYQPFNRIYLEVDPARLTTAAAPLLQDFVTAAHAQGIAVELLNANQSLVTTAALAQAGVQVCAAVREYNAAAPPAARLDGVHWDLEPHTLAGWTSNRANGSDPYNDLFQTNLLAIFAGCKAALNGTNTTQAWDMAVFYPRFATDIMTPLLNQRLVDYVAVMNYYNSEALFLNGQSGTGGVVNVLQQLRGQMPAVFIAHAGSDGPASGTWWYQGVLPMENMLGNVGDAYATHPSVWGLAVHDFDAHIRLEPYGPPLAPTCSHNGTVLTINPNGVTVASLGVYRGASRTYVTHGNTAGPGPYTVATTRTPPFSVNLWDGPNLSRASINSLVYIATC
jgi:hypothetical protein